MLPGAVRDLAPPGDLTSMQTYNFEFNEVEMQYDSYRGLQVRLRCPWHLHISRCLQLAEVFLD